MVGRIYTHWELRNVIFAAIRRSGDRGLTRSQIAAIIGRRKNPLVVAAINELIEEKLILEVDLKRGKQSYFLYFAADQGKAAHEVLFRAVLDKP